MEATAVDLSLFCDPDSEKLAASFVRSGKRYATDSAIAVCVPADGEPDTPEPDRGIMRPPNCKGVFAERFDGGAIWLPLPEPKTLDDRHDCFGCNGYGVINKKQCPSCKGEGFRLCDMGHEHDCDGCNESGFVGDTCPECQGKRRVDGPAYQAMGDQWIDLKYDRLLRSLPWPVEWAFANATKGRRHDCIQFRFPGAIGLLMTLDKDLLPTPTRKE